MLMMIEDVVISGCLILLEYVTRPMYKNMPIYITVRIYFTVQDFKDL